ncbi:YhbY family RNA-binding protein [Companilactobacillus allii]|uniref:RNA-binding protein n=1 Tax=Companilactobacillus allii TaxID=1847728 RepID=A0A1P8Q3W1_9LACO|nr:YhbY family RNA-binding protein [Companilactobacillus allii]APX72540.1 RNA-binding protein [Companilactobacillus allii]USQ69642.1 YhbY family RNA-binding protein [Companilactobacillus allii]
MIIKGKKNSYLRGQAQTIKPLIQVGREGISDNLLQQIETLVNTNELLKISLLQNTMVEPKELITALMELDDQIVPVQTIGSKVIIYKKAPKIKNRKYSLELEKI